MTSLFEEILDLLWRQKRRKGDFVGKFSCCTGFYMIATLFVNPFHATVLFLYSLKISENQKNFLLLVYLESGLISVAYLKVANLARIGISVRC